MASLSNKIRQYVEAEVDFEKDVLLQDDRIAGVSKPYIKEWNLDIAKPTDAQLDALEDEANAKEALNTILNNRRKKYPSIVDQLDDIYHNGIDGWKATIKVTKDKYPK